MQKKKSIPDYLFEIGWEVCNKVGGIHTVLSSKAPVLAEEMKTEHIFIGPDLMRENVFNPEFTEEPQLLKSWRIFAGEHGLGVRIGRWNIPSRPIAILVDFSHFITQKDDILKELWEQYQVDSIYGRWEYVESVLFGYAAGRAIENFVNFHSDPHDTAIAHFHEWMTGSGVLYLKQHCPRIATVFTTHATVTGRSIAGNNRPLYDNMLNYNADELAGEFNIRSKHSLEKKAAQMADSFTTVSGITAKECQQFLGRQVDVVTPNGFSHDNGFGKQAGIGRKKMLEVAETLLGTPTSPDALLIGTSGRYEFRNKGLDVFIQMLGKLNQNKSLQKEILAFLYIPAGSHGSSRELLNNLHNKDKQMFIHNKFVTHNLYDPHYDPIIKAIKENGLTNNADSKVKVIFVPSYLNGNDEIFNINYYDILADLDLTFFPSYYEPWGYTPLESIAYGVPTVTTNLAGFGLWVRDDLKQTHPSVTVINRTDNNTLDVVEAMTNRLLEQASMSDKQVGECKSNALQIAESATWKNFIKFYSQAYAIALNKAEGRYDKNIVMTMDETRPYPVNIPQNSMPNWHTIMVQRTIPEKLRPLDELSKNLWWSWTYEAVELFKYIDPVLWKKVEYNPIELLDKVSHQRFLALVADSSFLNKLNYVYQMFLDYMSKKEEIKKTNHIAYFSMEYGLHSSLKVYSGGLGILAGDYLKEASDKEVNITAVGLLYRYGYFTQKLSAAGDQVAQYEPQQFDKIPISPVRDSSGNWMSVEIAFPGRIIHAKIWRVDVGRTELYLLDTDIDVNLDEDRSVTYHLYGGDWENRLKQEILLGVGGIRTLEKLGVKANVYHCNEGHAAMIGLERMHHLIWKNKLSFDEAKEVVRASSLFTTHTPVPAGHDSFDEGLLRKYISHYPERFQVPWERIISLGRMNPNDPNEKFSMSCLATNLSQEVNGVSWLHGEVTRDMLQGMFPGYLTEELFIGYVTNGVHYPTWTAPAWKKLYEKVFGPDFSKHHYDKSCFGNIQKVDDKEIWDIRNSLRSKLVDHVKSWISNQNDINYYSPRETVEIKETLDPTKLTIGFARRFATYKRAHLLFKNLDQLNDIINHPEHPVQFIFAGKAHPADKAGQDLIKKIVEISKYPQFLGKILFLEDYDMELAAKMVRGVDIWLNTPTRPLEASGTSGEKAVMNGVMHFSVLDGWWVEGYREDAGWCLPMERSYANDDFQNELDAETIYSIIENEIAPTYYSRDKNNIPQKWISKVKNSIDKVASEFTTNRMMADYEERFYTKLEKRSAKMNANDYQMARDISTWKHKVLREWDSVEILSVKQPSMDKEPILLGKDYEAEVLLSIGYLNPEDVAVELLLAEEANGKKSIKQQKQFELVSHGDHQATYKLNFSPEISGIFSVGIRIYATNENLPHRQDFCLVKWA